MADRERKRTGSQPSAHRAQAERVPGSARADAASQAGNPRATSTPRDRSQRAGGRAGGVGVRPCEHPWAGLRRGGRNALSAGAAHTHSEPRRVLGQSRQARGLQGQKAGECEMPLARSGGRSGQPCPPGEGPGVRCVASPCPSPRPPACCLSISRRAAGLSTRAAPWL